MKFFIFLFLILCSALAFAYSPGERLNITYSNITNTTYPCLLVNGFVYLAGNISLGNTYCEINYYSYYESSSESSEDSSSSSSSSKSSKPSNATKAYYTKPVKISVTKGVEYIDKIVEKIVDRPYEVVVNQTIEKEIPVPESSAKTYLSIFIIAILSLIVIYLIGKYTAYWW